MDAPATGWRLLQSHAVCLFAAAFVLSSACGSRLVTPTGASAATPTPPPPTPTATPRYSVAGIVREVNGGPLADVRIVTNPNVGATTTDGAGVFSFTDISPTTLVFQKAGFESSFWKLEASFVQSPVPVTIRMEPSFVLSADAGVSSVITNDDLSYSSDKLDPFWDGAYFCAPCKQMSVAAARGSGKLHLHWMGPVPLELWAGEYYGAPQHAAGAAGDSELVLEVAPGRLEAVLVGIGGGAGEPKTLAGPIAFDLTIER
jgi:hypothetical protein